MVLRIDDELGQGRAILPRQKHAPPSQALEKKLK
jgi:hypothetical protein